MAIDLRFILAVIKINGDLERVGDQSMSIAIRTQELLAHPAVDLPVDIASMGEHALAHDSFRHPGTPRRRRAVRGSRSGHGR